MDDLSAQEGEKVRRIWESLGMDTYILVDRVPVREPDTLKWAEWFSESREERVVAQEEVGSVTVSTVFLGLNHSFDGCGLEIFETMVFRRGESIMCQRASTWEEAENNHKAMVEKFTPRK